MTELSVFETFSLTVENALILKHVTKHSRQFQQFTSRDLLSKPVVFNLFGGAEPQ